MPSQNKLITLISIFFSMLIVNRWLFPSVAFSGSMPGHLLGIAGATLMLSGWRYAYLKRVLKRRGKKNPLAPHVYCGITGATLVAMHAAYGFASLIGSLTFLSMLLIVLTGIVGTFLFRWVSHSLSEQKADLEAMKTLFRNRRHEIVACQRMLSTEGFHLLEPLGLQIPVGQQGLLMKEEPSDPHGPEDALLQVTSTERCKGLLSVAQSMAELEYTTQVFMTVKRVFSYWLMLHIYIAVFLTAMVAVHVLSNLYYGIRWLP